MDLTNQQLPSNQNINQPQSYSQPRPKTSKTSIAAVVIATLIIIGGIGGYVFVNKSTIPQSPNGVPTQPSQGPITIEGDLVCLPHKDKTGPQTEECALGIQATDGKYYALEISQEDLIQGKFATGRHTRVSGIFMAKSSSGYENKYDIVGTIKVESFAESENATVEPGDTQGGLALYPDLFLTSIPDEPVTVKFVVEHRSALNEKSIRVQGVVVGTLLGEAACPPGRGACAQPRIFLADTNKNDRDKSYDIMILVSEEEKGYKVDDKIEVKVTVYSSKTTVYLQKVY